MVSRGQSGVDARGRGTHRQGPTHRCRYDATTPRGMPSSALATTEYVSSSSWSTPRPPVNRLTTSMPLLAQYSESTPSTCWKRPSVTVGRDQR